MTVRTLVLDVGTSSVRAAIVAGTGAVERELVEELLPESPGDGLVQFDAARLAEVTRSLATRVLDDEAVDGVGITNQRASTVVWDRATGAPVAPGLGWQDLRTIGACFAAREFGLRLAPNQTATKAQWILDQVDPDRRRDLVVGTVDSWITWVISEGSVHVTDTTNAGVTGLVDSSMSEWSLDALTALRIPPAALPHIVGSAGAQGHATALPGGPPIVARLGDQQASLAGQSCVEVGQAKVTFGTGGMLDQNLGDRVPRLDGRAEHGTFPIAAWRVGDDITWGLEAVMLAAGTNLHWLRDDLALIASAAQSHDVASECASSEGVVYVPALNGLGTPWWDYGARSAFYGVTRGTTRAHLVRAVLEGIAHRGADLVEAAEADSGIAIPALRIDGGMSDNPTFVQALADATQRRVEVAAAREATTIGAGLVAALALGEYGSMADLAGVWEPRAVVEPRAPLDRTRWLEAVARSRRWIPDLSNIDF